MNIDGALDIPLVSSGIGLVKAIEGFGYTAVLAGGCVRDLVRWQLGLDTEPGIHDVDIATNMPMAELREKFRCESNNGEAHGTLLVFHDGMPFEVTQYRADGSYSDGRHPDAVQWAETFEEDCRRRDFTMNAMGLSSSLEVIDFHGGVEAIRTGMLSTVGDPLERFGEDALRVIRAYRFAARFNMDIHPVTRAACLAMGNRVSCLSRERLHDEFTKTAAYGLTAFGRFIGYLAEGVGKYVDPAVEWGELTPMLARLEIFGMYNGWKPEFALALVFDSEKQMRDFKCSCDEISTMKFVASRFKQYMAGGLDLVDIVDGVCDARWDALRAYSISRQGYFVLKPAEEEKFRSFMARYPSQGDISAALADTGMAPGREFGDRLREIRRKAYRMMLSGKEIDREILYKLVAETPG